MTGAADKETSRDAGVPALIDALMRIGALIHATPDLEEIDINPLVVYPEGQGVLALDALLVAGGGAKL